MAVYTTLCMYDGIIRNADIVHCKDFENALVKVTTSYYYYTHISTKLSTYYTLYYMQRSVYILKYCIAI